MATWYKCLAVDPDNSGSTNQPIYAGSDSTTKKTNYTLGKSVPSGAVFTDTAVTQSNSTTANYRPLIMGYTNNASPASLTGTTTYGVYVANNLYAQPSTGLINAKIQQVDGKVQMQYNATNECLDFIFI